MTNKRKKVREVEVIEHWYKDWMGRVRVERKMAGKDEDWVTPYDEIPFVKWEYDK